VLICHRLILSRLFRSLLDQVLANLVRVADRFFDAEAILAERAMLYRSLGPADIAMSFKNRLGNRLSDSL
jgi:hypothetical protein